MPTLLTLAGALLAAASPQTPPAPQQPSPQPNVPQQKVPIQDLTPQPVPIRDPSKPAWTFYNGVALVVNEDIITARDIDKDLRYLESLGLLTTKKDRQLALIDVRTQHVQELIRVQAGQDLGLPEELMLRNVQSVMDRQVENAGGVTALAEDLKRRRTDSSERRKELADQLYSLTWSRIVTGEEAGASGRPTRDRYVRPGMRRFEYRRVLERPGDYTFFGGVSPAVEFRLLMIPFERAGGRRAARELAADVRELALEGADFEALVDTYGSYKGEQSRVKAELEILRQIEPDIAGYVEDASMGEISPVLKVYPIVEGRRTTAWGIVKMLERVEAVPPDFADREVQLKLHKHVERLLDDERIKAALRLLLQSAFVFPPLATDLE